MLSTGITIAVGSIATWGAALYLGQRSLIWPRPPEVAPPTAYGGGSIVEVGPHRALYMEPKTESAPTIVFFHGNGDQLGWGAC